MNRIKLCIIAAIVSAAMICFGFPREKKISVSAVDEYDSTKIYSSTQKRTAAIRWIVIHHTGAHCGAPCNIDKYHSTHNGWSCGISYHYYIMFDGSKVKIHNDDELTAHAVGRNNNGVSICFDGNKPNDSQLAAIADKTWELMQKYDIPLDHVIGHGDVNATACPGFDINILRNLIKNRYGR